MSFIFISPHLDDVVLSCGGLLNRIAAAQIITLFAGVPDMPSYSRIANNFHKTCGLDGNAIQARREEDVNAAKVLSFKPIHLSVLECLYRKDQDNNFLYNRRTKIFSNKIVDSEESILYIEKQLKNNLPIRNIIQIFIPLGIGGHVDHLIVRKIVEKMALEYNFNDKIVYYEDMPYALFIKKDVTITFKKKFSDNLIELTLQDFNKKIEAIHCYTSQIDMLWEHSGCVVPSYLNYSNKLCNKKGSYYERYWKKRN